MQMSWGLETKVPLCLSRICPPSIISLSLSSIPCRRPNPEPPITVFIFSLPHSLSLPSQSSSTVVAKLPISAIGEISKGATTKRKISLDQHRLQGDRYSVVVNIQGDPKQILVAHIRFFAVKLSDRWSKQQRTSNPYIVEIADCDDVEVYIEALSLMYCKDLRKKLMKEDVTRVLGILKAFAFSSTAKAKRLQLRASEKEQRRLHVPTIDWSIGEPAPYVVLVQGPPQETFEFLNILQNRGFPKIMGVLTHIDKFKDVKKLKKTKQRLKHRYWTEIYDGAKLFYLSGLIHGKYAKCEVHNLARFISVMKFHPLSWQTTHPYVLVDRFEDVTPPERVHMDNKCNRNVTLCGYLRGCNLKKGTKGSSQSATLGEATINLLIMLMH
ncbi:uncharacterized protein LOC114285688 isoform X2 [Camellia sinensis]|uniref:uncharacterized protein LOC114285688 isoform X2 n=1 Tax=Camellia sinensis TaxID=4442 RepID=UPI0010365B17|nr:uncharacterized protein LOC114285688 isoform X2 [Camellia sinensis]XP_028084567.1 uncharacterized protein LOC114285688 isoform X2 [Camellia sinensis]